MASTSTQQSCQSPRRLAELLNEQQEPFVLEVYLRERGYRIRSLELNGRIMGCCAGTNHNTSKKLLKKITQSDIRDKNRSPFRSYQVGEIPASKYKPSQFSSIVRTFLTRFGSRKSKRKPSENQVVELRAGRCSSVSYSTTLSSNTWSDSETDGGFISMPSPVTNEALHDESASNRVMTTQWQDFEEKKQCSPDSVLEEIDLLQSIPVYNNVRQQHQQARSNARIRFQKKVSEDAILSASLWDLLVNFRTEKPKRKRGRHLFPDYMNSKRALQENRQLLFDCVREAVESGKQQKSTSNRGLLMGPEEIGKSICRHLKIWGKLSADEANIKKVLKLDLLGGEIEDEWGGFEPWKREIVGEIGNGIVDEIIEDILRDMTD